MKGIKIVKPPKLRGKTKYQYLNHLEKLVGALYGENKKKILNLYRTKNIEQIKSFVQALEETSHQIFTEQSKRLIEQFSAEVKRDLQKEVGFLRYDHRYDNRIKADIENNISLIKNIPQKSLFNLQQDIFNSIANDDNERSFYSKLVEQEGITKRRAKTIARDQTAKLYASITQASQQSNGFEYFIWRTAKDSRVSTGQGGHRQLDGKIYRWGDKNNYPVIDSQGNRGLPSERVNCRCIALPVVIQDGYEMVKQSDGSYLARKVK